MVYVKLGNKTYEIAINIWVRICLNSVYIMSILNIKIPIEWLDVPYALTCCFKARLNRDQFVKGQTANELF